MTPLQGNKPWKKKMKQTKIDEGYIREYVSKRFSREDADVSQEGISAMANVMSRYGNNFWWESRNSLELAKYQIFENILICPYDKFLLGLEKLLERSIIDIELSYNIEGLRLEARKAILKGEKNDKQDT